MPPSRWLGRRTSIGDAAEADGSSSRPSGLALVRRTRQLWSSHGEPLRVHGGRAPRGHDRRQDVRRQARERAQRACCSRAGNSRRSLPSKSGAASGRAGSKVSSSPLNGRSAELTSTTRAGRGRWADRRPLRASRSCCTAEPSACEASNPFAGGPSTASGCWFYRECQMSLQVASAHRRSSCRTPGSRARRFR